jgi:hypothetical protein
MDATFTSQFGTAVQSEILQQAARYRQGHLADSEEVTATPTRPVSALRWLVGALLSRVGRSHGSMPAGTNMTALPHSSFDCASD